ncbi:MAG TPA: riboflavin biosynthesis protein RibF [Planctomycetota bacterium]|nr:riboflavin biosynthesis protein RibF [Planctomycetota bacterium]
MRIHRNLDALEPSHFRAPAVTLGVFDGVHEGHRTILGALAEAAARTGGEKVVVTFDRHPRALLTGDAPPTITSLEHRLVLFERAGIDAAVVLRFDARLAAMTAEEFLRDVLVGRIGARAIVLGADSHFGKDRVGSIAFLEERRERYGYELVSVPLLQAAAAGAEVVSSTAIRRAVREGRLADAARMLGRPPSLLGRVERGDARGRTIGFPTANLALHQELAPPRGVYVARVEVDLVRYRALVNIGVRPTFKTGELRELVEVHLLGFEGSLYGRVLEVELVRRLRDERRFASVDDLVAQLRRDRDAALEDLRPAATA